MKIGSRALEHRQRATGGSAKMYGVLAEWFGPVASFEDWHYLAQVLQARAVSIAVGWARANRPRCMGALVWQLNDCWAGHSWAMVDVDGRKKPAWYALREAATARVMVHEVGGRPMVYAVNEGDEPIDVEARARRMRFDGEVLVERELRLRCDSRAAAACGDLAELLGSPGDPSREMLVVDGRAGRAVWFFGVDRELAYPRPELDARAEVVGEGTRLTLRAGTLVRDIVIAADRLDPEAEVSEQLLTMLPGEEQTVELRGVGARIAAALIVRPVFQCANWFGRRA